jgi:azurin
MARPNPAALRRRSRLLARLTLLSLGAMTLADCRAPPPPPAHVYIESDGDFLSFKPATLTVKTGARVILTFRHSGQIISQNHDWVLAQPDSMKALLAVDDKMAQTAPMDNEAFLKLHDPRVIAATSSIQKGQTTTIEFTAPPPGDYPFFCSTPGHGDSMNGVLHVVP